eukprot:8626728-Ditylum_brightwellii.AAC.1
MAMRPLQTRMSWKMRMLLGGRGSPVMSNQDVGTGQDITNGATGGTIGTDRATQKKYSSSQRKKQGLIYDIINKKKTAPPWKDTNTENETESDNDIALQLNTENTINQHPPLLSESTNVDSQGGDKID